MMSPARGLKVGASRMTNWVWGALAAVALLWPSRLSGPFDGLPLDAVAEAIVIGIVLPALCWFHPAFLRSTFARAIIAALLVWKAFTALTLVQDGLCIRFMPAEPYVREQTGAPHSWDVRADWRASDPRCSAIMTRSYQELSEFPAWFFNLPPPNDSWPGPRDRPPGAKVAMAASGFVHAQARGRLRVLTNSAAPPVVLDAGGDTPDDLTRRVFVETTLTGDRWRFVPQWNGSDVWSVATVTVGRPSRLDLAIRPWGRGITAALVVMLTLAWLMSVASRLDETHVLLWTIGASAWIGTFAPLGQDEIARWSVLALAAAALLRVPARLRNIFGAFALVGIPWLTLVAGMNAGQAGHFRLYDIGSDFWAYQRFAYRIVMQGYWLEGGSLTFWFQPFYRWIAGLLHLVFGDSSVGEAFWDGACVLVMALFAFAVTKTQAGFRWGLAAAALTLGVYAVGTPWGHLGRGLADTSSTGLVYLSALLVLRGRHGRWRPALAAGLIATIAFYTRLNNLLLTLALAAFALPLRAPIHRAFRPSTWLAASTWPTVVIIWTTIGAGVLCFSWRTYHYTGVFSVLYGTSGYRQAIWQHGMSFTAYVRALASSVSMQATMNDPPRFDARAMPIMAGLLASALAVVGVPRLRDLPAGLVLFCLAGIAGAFVARGEAYSGRFSIQLIGVTCAVVACALGTTRRRASYARSAPAKSALVEQQI